MVKVEPIGKVTTLGEGPHWDEHQQVLYFVDIKEGTVHKYDPASKTQTSVKVGDHTSLVVPVDGKQDEFVVTMGGSLALMTWDGKSSTPSKLETVFTLQENDAGQGKTFNDGKVDPTGRFWAGTLGKLTEPMEIITKGSLFSFSKDWKPTTRLTEVSLTNGMTWSPDMKTMYYIDSDLANVCAFDFNAQTGEISNRRIAFDFKKNNLSDSLPDGMTIDAEGKLWIACFRGGQVIRVDPTSGKVLSTVSVPSPQPTSVAFGGRNLDELYITCGNIAFLEDVPSKDPYAGFTFRVTGVGAKGLPMKNVNLA